MSTDFSQFFRNCWEEISEGPERKCESLKPLSNSIKTIGPSVVKIIRCNSYQLLPYHNVEKLMEIYGMPSGFTPDTINKISSLFSDIYEDLNVTKYFFSPNEYEKRRIELMLEKLKLLELP